MLRMRKRQQFGLFSVPNGSRSSKYEKRDHSTLLFCRRQQRNVQTNINARPQPCTAN